MKVVVLGASGTLGTALGDRLRHKGVEVVPAQRSSGVDAYAGTGLAEAFAGADVVVDCLNLTTTSAHKAIDFFRTSATNVGEAAKAVGASVVCLTIANAGRPEVNAKFGYYQGKAAQEEAYRAVLPPSSLTFVASTQWYELAEDMMSRMRLGPIAVVPRMRCRPAAAADVAEVMAGIVTGGGPGAGTVEVAGPETVDLVDVARAVAEHDGSPRKVFGIKFGGAAIRSGGLVPDNPDVTTSTTLAQWVARRGR